MTEVTTADQTEGLTTDIQTRGPVARLNLGLNPGLNLVLNLVLSPGLSPGLNLGLNLDPSRPD